MALGAGLRERLTLPAFCAPMFLCSNAELAIECCKAGIVGSLTANHHSNLAALESELATVSQALARFSDRHPGRATGPLAVNISPTKDAADFRAHLDACKRHGTAIIVTSVGNPAANAPIVRDSGMMHFHDVTSVRFAEKAIEAGVDGIVAIGAGGGGHAGTISHLALIPKIRTMFAGTLVMAGGVTTGANIRAAEILGADLAYIGTRFIATQESGAPDAYKAMLVSGGVDDVIYTRGVNGMPASWLKESLRESGLDPDSLFIPEGRNTDHLPAGKTPWRNIWSAGQGIGLIADIPATAELVARLQQEYLDACSVPNMVQSVRSALRPT